VAEFVENEKILDVLIDLDIEYGQGYYFDKAKPYNEI
jgi:EAL domain-containing protein (putative c-di-GMP-specific phosphodiesterase class I)